MADGNGRYRVGFDIGGTFTDFVLYDADTAEGRVHKCLTTPDDPSQGALEGLNDLLASTSLGTADVSHLIHGTTLVSIAIIERRGAKLALLTTRGFRDVLVLRTLRMPRLYDIGWEKPPPLVPRYLRLEVDERVDAAGAVERALEPSEVDSAIDRLLAEGVEAIAVCLINSFANLITSAGAGAKVFHLLARSPHALTGREAPLGRGEVGEDKR